LKKQRANTKPSNQPRAKQAFKKALLLGRGFGGGVL